MNFFYFNISVLNFSPTFRQRGIRDDSAAKAGEPGILDNKKGVKPDGLTP